jgi:uncharacterized membrane protein
MRELSMQEVGLVSGSGGACSLGAFAGSVIGSAIERAIGGGLSGGPPGAALGALGGALVVLFLKMYSVFLKWKGGLAVMEAAVPLVCRCLCK